MALANVGQGPGPLLPRVSYSPCVAGVLSPSLGWPRLAESILPSAALFTHRHHLCRSRHYCRDVGHCTSALHGQVERLVRQAGQQADSSVTLYYFNASLYLLRVLKGSANKKHVPGGQQQQGTGASDVPEDSDSQVSGAQSLRATGRTGPRPHPVPPHLA